MYGKFFLVFFSLLLLMVSVLLENFQSLHASQQKFTSKKVSAKCYESLLPVANGTSFSTLVREERCEK